MKVKNLIEALLRLPPEHEIIFERDTNYGRVEYDYSHCEVRKELKPKYAYAVTYEERCELATNVGDAQVIGIEETPERCIMVLS